MTETWRTNDAGTVGHWTRLAEHRVKLAAATYAVGANAKIQTPTACEEYEVVSVTMGGDAPAYAAKAWRLAVGEMATPFAAIEAVDYPHDTECVITW